ncbi:efflux RND transporter periplasmic adaptor subunit [Fundidesulfovibrio soli]|uniref:efflux RND transporter periplasmic adaptor subunit n=1 Tax=Fundidesulfovibrio soli TaxID=2922716 RepID=UPI001FAF92FA|nr:efflux RND transporter periplasmic adaptor subunit [Fundidesulfovibrio soli]
MNVSAPRPEAWPLARLFVLLAILCLLALASACSQNPEKAPADSGGQAAPKAAGGESTEGKLVLYACPMNDIPPLPAPGKCPVCGMGLAPVVVGDMESGNAARNHLDPAQMRLAGISTSRVESRYVTALVDLYGQIEYDDAFIADINAPVNGIVDKVYIRRSGEYIRTDQRLFDFYSADIQDVEIQLLEQVRMIPDIVSSLLGQPVNQALRSSSGTPPDEKATQDAQRKFAMLRSRLKGFGLPDKDIAQILRLERPPGVIPIRMPNLASNVGGVIIENNAVQGAYVNKGTRLVRIADPNFVLASFDAFEQDFPWLRIGQEVEFSSPARPGESFWGKVLVIEPTFSEKNKTFRVLVGYNDVKTLLRPGMSLRGKVKALLDREGRPTSPGTAPERAPLVIPESAPLVTGGRAVVYVAVQGKPGVFEGREIVLGPKAEGFFIVQSGLTEGDEVVTNGAFKLDSERQILAKPSMLQPEGLVRLQDFGLNVAPPAAIELPPSERPNGPSPIPAFPPAEIFGGEGSVVPEDALPKTDEPPVNEQFKLMLRSKGRSPAPGQGGQPKAAPQSGAAPRQPQAPAGN